MIKYFSNWIWSINSPVECLLHLFWLMNVFCIDWWIAQIALTDPIQRDTPWTQNEYQKWNKYGNSVSRNVLLRVIRVGHVAKKRVEKRGENEWINKNKNNFVALSAIIPTSYWMRISNLQTARNFSRLTRHSISIFITHANPWSIIFVNFPHLRIDAIVFAAHYLFSFAFSIHTHTQQPAPSLLFSTRIYFFLFSNWLLLCEASIVVVVVVGVL